MDPHISAINYKEFKTVFDTNVFGALLCAKHAARVMTRAKSGSIIFTSSVCSVTYGDVPHIYTASKHAVVGLTKNLCVELGHHGIRVNCISPFGVATPMLLKGIGSMQKEEMEEFVSDVANLKGPRVKTDDIAMAALYLGSDEGVYVSGLNLVVDGGYSTTNVALKQGIEKIASTN